MVHSMTTAGDVLAIARAEIGNREIPAGSNRQKYGTWYGMDGVAWCAIWVSYCFFAAGMPLPITTSKGFAYCPSGVAWFKQKGLWHTANPQPGDIVFFDWYRRNEAWHVGIVESVNGTAVVTLEGNTSLSNQDNGGKVMRRDRSSGLILGYGRPQFDTSGGRIGRGTPVWPGRYLVLTSPYVQGADVEKWQAQVTARGFQPGPIDGIYGQMSAAACKRLQDAEGIEVDGIVGPVTWATTWEV